MRNMKFLIVLTLMYILVPLHNASGIPAGDGIKIASLSYIPEKWDKEAYLHTIVEMAREAAANGAELIITPEGAMEGYLIDVLREKKNREEWESKFQEIAESIEDPGVVRIRTQCPAC
ncbi:nitrilase-related carbon-nitrogen hydrolase [Bacteroidota bacterium]